MQVWITSVVDAVSTRCASASLKSVLDSMSFQCFQELLRIETEGNRKKTTLRHVLNDTTEVRIVENVVMEYGAAPLDAIYHELKGRSRNAGQLNHHAMITGTSPFVDINPGNGFYLARIGDAVANRYVHAAM